MMKLSENFSLNYYLKLRKIKNNISTNQIFISNDCYFLYRDK